MKGRRYTLAQEGAFKISVLDVLSNSEDALTIDEIKAQDPMELEWVTAQKLSRVIGSLVEMGLVMKSKSKNKNRMVYKSVSKMIEQGYVEPTVTVTPPYAHNKNWELEEELRLNKKYMSEDEKDITGDFPQ